LKTLSNTVFDLIMGEVLRKMQFGSKSIGNDYDQLRFELLFVNKKIVR